MTERLVVLIRHGEAVSHASSDSRRELTERGRKQALATAGQLATWWADYNNGPVLLIHSPYVRAEQTAAYVRQAANPVAVQTSDQFTPDINPVRAWERLGALAGKSPAPLVVLVAHMPLVAALEGLALESTPYAGEPFYTGEGRVISFSEGDLLPGCGRSVRRFLNP